MSGLELIQTAGLTPDCYSRFFYRLDAFPVAQLTASYENIVVKVMDFWLVASFCVFTFQIFMTQVSNMEKFWMLYIKLYCIMYPLICLT